MSVSEEREVVLASDWQIGYPKIETLFERDMETFRVTENYRLEEFSLINHWLITEKIDGTNIRIFRDGDGNITYGGRTANAQIPATLMEPLGRIGLKVNDAFDADAWVVLFGEGYGAGIQKGGDYRAEASFRLFDVAVMGGEVGQMWWLNWPDVEDVARKLDIPTVPVLHEQAHLGEAIDLHSGPSPTAIEDEGPGRDREGIVARTNPLLFDRHGRRVMWKLKVVDFQEGKR